MKLVFADSFYFLALINADDSANKRASEFTNAYTGQYLTTSAVLTEVADALARPISRVAAASFIKHIPSNKAIRITMVDQGIFSEALALYLARPDKDWSLTDCMSFTLMGRERITEALTADKHFEQAGFVCVLK